MNKICICINFYIEIEICDFRSSSFSFDFLIIQKIKPSPIPYQPFNCWFVHLREPEFRSFNWKQKRTDIKADNLLCQSGFPLESLQEASFLLLDFLAWIFLLFAFFLSFPFFFVSIRLPRLFDETILEEIAGNENVRFLIRAEPRTYQVPRFL